jgi:hypothetical protein
MEGLESGLLEGVLCTIFFFKEAMPKSSKRQRSLHMLARHLMAQLPSLQEPCAVKVVREEGFSVRILLKRH